MKRILTYVCTCLVILLTSSCDIFEKDVDRTNDINVRMFTPIEKSTVIDLSKVVPNFKSVATPDNAGTLQKYNQLMKYRFSKNGEDKFSLSVKESDDLTANVKVSVSQLGADDCSTNAPFTYAKITNKEMLVVNLLNNPEFCDYNIYSYGSLTNADPRPGIDEIQNTEGVNVEVCACGPLGDHANLTYTPPVGFVGQVKFKYYIGVGGDPERDGDAVYYDPKYSQYFSAHEVIIDVTDAAL